MSQMSHILCKEAKKCIEMQSQLLNDPIFRFPFAWKDRFEGIQALWVQTKLLIGVF